MSNNNEKTGNYTSAFFKDLFKGIKKAPEHFSNEVMAEFLDYFNITRLEQLPQYRYEEALKWFDNKALEISNIYVSDILNFDSFTFVQETKLKLEGNL